MKPLSVLIDPSCWPPTVGDRTGTLTAANEPELLPDGWLRFKTKDGQWHRLPPHSVKCVTENREPDKNIAKPIVEVPYLVSKRGRPAKS